MLPSGMSIGTHVLVRYTASGATCEIYEGRHVASSAPVAVKVLHEEWCVHPELIARFLNEATALRRLRHPRIVTAFDLGTLPDERPFVVLEWLPLDLQQVLAKVGGRLPAPTAVRVAAQLAEGLLVLHERGMVHRDLKPANVLVAQQESDGLEIKLADLGLAKALVKGGDDNPAASEKLSPFPVSTGADALLGTWDYMAPEQWIRSKGVDEMADVYSLGVVLFQMLTGRLPFIAQEQKDLMILHLFEPPPVNLLDGSVSARLRNLLTRMLGKKPVSRPSMREIQEQLSKAL